jgi:outer membrane protein TolC
MVLACGAATGCKQQMFLDKQCFDEASALLPPPAVETDFTAGDTPMMGQVKSPATLIDPDRPTRFLTLREAFAIALENGSVSDAGGFGSQINGIVNDALPSFATGSGFNAQTDRVKALALNPAIAGANLEASLSRFDAQWVTAMNWSATDNIQQGLASFQNGDAATFQSSIVKGLASGGVASMSFTNNYKTLNQIPVNALSPLYESRLDIGFEQPLWRDFGTDINQVLARFPSFNGTSASSAAASYNSRQNAGNNLGVGTEGILISRIRIEQQRAEFERRVHNLLVNAEVAYWRLYQAYGRLYSFEEVMRIAHKAWLTNHAKFVAGTIGPANYYPIRGQYEEFRGERMAALGNVLEVERNLRGILGLPVEDGTRLVPIDAPTMAPYQPNWDASVQMALMQKPELAIARENLRANQYTLVSQKNFLKPDLRAFGRYSPVGFGNRLDGNGQFDQAPNVGRTDNALRSLAGGDFADWSLGLTLSMPLGFRMEHAAVRFARLQLAQSYYLLQDAEQRTIRSLSKDYQKMSEWYSLIEARRAERKAYADSVEARFREFAVGKTTVADFLLEAQRRLATAQVKEYEAIAEYNIALSSFEYRKGNIMKHNNVVIAEGALPVCAEVRAVDHEQERARAHILRERPTPLGTPARLAGQVGELPRELNVPSDIPQMVTPNFSQTKTSPAAAPVNAGPNFGPGVSMVQPVDGTPVFRSVPQGRVSSGPVSAAPEIVNIPSGASQPSLTANGLTSTVAPLRATPRN